ASLTCVVKRACTARFMYVAKAFVQARLFTVSSLVVVSDTDDLPCRLRAVCLMLHLVACVQWRPGCAASSCSATHAPLVRLYCPLVDVALLSIKLNENILGDPCW
ncbi:unnamed protein product, partial [Ectocarpus sp. 8 AP-2014]